LQLVLITGSGSKVGKTLLGSLLVKKLVEMAIVVSAIKHVHHGVDYRVKDTGRYLEAGAQRVVAIGDGEYMVVVRRKLSLEEALKLLGGSDVIIIEGFRNHVHDVLEKGGCVVYLGDDKLLAGINSEKIVYADKNSLGYAVDKVIGLLKRGQCTIKS
jgi:molybdopterin-guanine dinucleotide biosynthesis protein B